MPSAGCRICRDLWGLVRQLASALGTGRAREPRKHWNFYSSASVCIWVTTRKWATSVGATRATEPCAIGRLLGS